MANVTPQQIWTALEQAGASSVQAAGIMANMINESALNPEAVGDGGTSFGLVQQHGNFGHLVTGNPQADMQAQINSMIASGGLRAASGSTPAQAAGNFAANFERCVGCQPGGAQYNSRVANVPTVTGWASSGSWPAASGQASDTATLTAASTGTPANCAWQINFLGGAGGGFIAGILGAAGIGSAAGGAGLTGFCVLSNSQARALIGAGVLVGGVLIAGVGMELTFLAVGLAVASKVTAFIPGVGRATSVVRRAGPAKGAPAAAPAAAEAPASTGTVADSSGTSPEFRKQYGLAS